jgi:hypothetical protein
MATDREVLETIARCVSIMVWYHNSEKTPETSAMMTADLRQVAAWLAEQRLDHSEIENRIVDSVASELLIRHGYDIAPGLYNVFLRAIYCDIGTRAHGRRVAGERTCEQTLRGRRGAAGSLPRSVPVP